MSVLFKWKADWADEFDMVGIRLLSNKEWKHFQEAIEKIEYPHEFCFGTNEFYTYESVEAFKRGFKVVEDITIQDKEVLNKLFPPLYEGQSLSFGWDPIDQVMESLSDEDYEKITGEVL